MQSNTHTDIHVYVCMCVLFHTPDDTILTCSESPMFASPPNRTMRSNPDRHGIDPGQSRSATLIRAGAVLIHCPRARIISAKQMDYRIRELTSRRLTPIEVGEM